MSTRRLVRRALLSFVSCGDFKSFLTRNGTRNGTRSEEQLQERLKSLPQELTPQRAASELAIFELDGWQARYRGPGFGKKKTKKQRVEIGNFAAECLDHHLGRLHCPERLAPAAYGHAMAHLFLQVRIDG